MKRVRFQLSALLAWFFLFYNIESLDAPIRLSSGVYFLTTFAALAFLLIPQVLRISFVGLVALLTPSLVALRVGQGLGIGGADFPIAVTEFCAVGVTLVLARQLGQSLEEFRIAACATLVRQRNEQSRPFETGQDDIIREVRRARTFDRSLTLAAISVSDDLSPIDLDRITQQFQREAARKYLAAQAEGILTQETKECDIITRRGHHFVAVLPETDSQGGKEFARRLVATAREQIGLDLNIGLSTFPDEEVTFVKMLERAESRMIPYRIRERDTRRSRDGSNGHPPNGLELRSHSGCDAELATPNKSSRTPSS